MAEETLIPFQVLKDKNLHMSATGKTTQGLGPESQGFSKSIFEISRFWFSRGWEVCRFESSIPEGSSLQWECSGRCYIEISVQNAFLQIFQAGCHVAHNYHLPMFDLEF